MIKQYSILQPKTGSYVKLNTYQWTNSYIEPQIYERFSCCIRFSNETRDSSIASAAENRLLNPHFDPAAALLGKVAKRECKVFVQKTTSEAHRR